MASIRVEQHLLPKFPNGGPWGPTCSVSSWELRQATFSGKVDYCGRSWTWFPAKLLLNPPLEDPEAALSNNFPGSDGDVKVSEVTLHVIVGANFCQLLL